MRLKMITLTLTWRALVQFLVANLALAEQHLVAAIEIGENLDSLEAIQRRVWSELKALGLTEGIDAQSLAVSIMELDNTGKLVEYAGKQIDLAVLNPLIRCYGANPLTGTFPIGDAAEEIGFQVGNTSIRVL
jgi:hypothetical protein